MQSKLMFLIGPPRSGSTLLTRMLGAHSQVHAPAEPHLLTPLAKLGFYGSVERADYDPIITRQAAREIVGTMEGGEERYLDALRAYTDRVYESLLAGSGRSWLLDKTPAYALELDFIVKLYPNARYILLTRNPMAIWSSVVTSFFDGDHEVAHAHNPLIERYVPAMARFIRTASVSFCHVRYEELVQDPELHMQRVCEFAGLEFEPGMVDYGKPKDGEDAKAPAARGLGDPMTVARKTRPTTDSLDKWTKELTGRPDKVGQHQEILARLIDEDLATWGFNRAELAKQLSEIDLEGKRAPRPKLTQHLIERRLVVMLRRNIHQNALGRLVRQIRFACDVLLR